MKERIEIALGKINLQERKQWLRGRITRVQSKCQEKLARLKSYLQSIRTKGSIQ